MTQVQPASTGSRQCRIEHATRGRVPSYLRSKGDWSPAAACQNLTEQAVRDYEHRAVLELVQDAHDAHDGPERTVRILARLDPQERRMSFRTSLISSRLDLAGGFLQLGAPAVSQAMLVVARRPGA